MSAIHSTQVSGAGLHIYWTHGSRTDATKLKNYLKDLGLERFAPDKNTPQAALKIALDRVCGAKRRLIRPLPAGVRGYAVVNEKKDENGNSLEHSVSFDIVLSDEKLWPVFQDPETGAVINPLEESQILHQFQLELDRCSSHKLGIAVARILDHLHGISLRKTGGVYYLPEAMVSKFDEVAKSIQDSAPDGSNVIYGVGLRMDDRLRKSVVHGLCRELENEVGSIERDVMTQDEEGNYKMKKRGLKTKEERCEKLRSRIEVYQKIFQTSLTELSDSLEKAESAVALVAFEQLGA